MRVLHAEPDRYGREERAALDAAGEIDYRSFEDQEAFRAALTAEPYDAVFVRVGLSIGQAELDAAPDLRWVVTPTTGLDHLDLDELAARDIAVISLKGQIHLLDTVHATAELTWALLLALVRHLPAAMADVADGRWRRDPFLGSELHGRTLGIVGCGRLGRMVAGYGLAFGMEVLACDIDPGARDLAPAGVTFTSPDGLLAAAHVLSLHLPLDDTTRGWLSAERLALLPVGAWLVNTARGELIDEGALLAALENGRLAGAALDVVADDSNWADRIPVGQPMLARASQHGDVIVTPHIGGYARDSIAATRQFVTQQFLRAAGT